LNNYARRGARECGREMKSGRSESGNWRQFSGDHCAE